MTTVSREISRNVWNLAGQITAADPGKTPPQTLPASPAGLSLMRKLFRVLGLMGGLGVVIAVFNGVVKSPPAKALAKEFANIRAAEAPDGSILLALQTWSDQWPLMLLAVVLLVLLAAYRWGCASILPTCGKVCEIPVHPRVLVIQFRALDGCTK